ncbi:conserved Plasmodium protein, unknown function [Plasmodium gallinaceum]|uniref:GYF domain-containing protein n=1 Tax=Plasmodium gallinaceum TaxID=5849 RepID=A0A1J1H2F0_PLAGA|nr:conserved Plasmodium protein, unknown function [Plasmodium gallinaceum]CRG97510.1 conserved Plasmodium protein, unknown function [Plasmodium gallinaceum]
MDINLYIHSIEIEFLNKTSYMHNNEKEQEDNIVYSLNLKVEDSIHENNENKNIQFFETPWYICFKANGHELCMMSYEINISHIFNLLENNERLILYLLRKNLKNDKVEYLHRNELNIKDEKFYDSTNSIIFESNQVKGKIKLYFKNGVIYNNLLNKINLNDFLKKEEPFDLLLKSEEFVKNKLKSEDIDNISQNKSIENDFSELINSGKTLYWIYLDDDNNEQGPFNSKTIFNWIISEYFEDNTFIRLHDKKKFYKLYEVIEYIEKNVLMSSQNDQLNNHLSGNLENKFYDNINKKDEIPIFDKLKVDAKTNDSEDIKKEYVNKENEIYYYLKNINNKEYKDQSNTEQINKNENNEELMRKNTTCENLTNYVNKKNEEKENDNGIKKNITPYDEINNTYNSKLKIENDMNDNRYKEEYQKIDVRNNNNTKSYKNTKKKNEVKQLKKEIKKIKEEMIKLKEKNYKKNLLINDFSGNDLCYASNKGKDDKEENIPLKENNDIIQNELHPNTIKENDTNNKNIHENNNNNDYHNKTPDELEEDEKKKSTNYSSIYNIETKKKINSSNNINEEFKVEKSEEKKKYIEIALSSINQAQECLLNIKKKRIASYLNKIINLSNYDSSKYFWNDRTELNDTRNINIKRDNEKNSSIKYSKCINYYDSSMPFIFTNNSKKKYTLDEPKKKKDKETYKFPKEQSIKKLIINVPLKGTETEIETEIDSLSKINNKKLLKNFKSKNTENKEKMKKKKEEVIKLCFNILNNNSKIIYDYNLNYDKFLKYVTLIQYNVRKWLKKKGICNNIFYYHHYYDIPNLSKLNNLNYKKLNNTHNNYIRRKNEERKIKEALNLKNIQNLRKKFLNYENNNIYDTYNFALENKKLRENEKGYLDDIAILWNIKKEKDLCFSNLRNNNYYTKILINKENYNQDEISEKHSKNNIYDIYDNFPLNNFEFIKSKTSLKKNDIEIIKENCNLKNKEVYIDEYHLNKNEGYNLHEYFSDILNKYKNFNNIKSVNDYFENFNKQNHIMKNSNKCSFAKLKDNNQVTNKKDILLRIVNNLKFDKILNEKKKNCKLQINLKSNSIFSMNPFIDNSNKIHLKKFNANNGRKYNNVVESNNYNVDRYNSRLSQIKFQDSNKIFCENSIKKKLLIDNTDKNNNDMFLLHDFHDNY